MSLAIRKYPRTPHLETSRLQAGDDDAVSLQGGVRFSELRGKHLVVEEKLDGQNAAVSFDDDGALLLQSRGHYLRGGAREKSFEPFKRWARVHEAALRDVLGRRYVMYGEWCFAKHTIFYDALPHYFLEFDIYDRERDAHLSTTARQALLQGLPVVSVPVLASRAFSSLDDVLSLVGPSTAKTPRWRDALRAAASKAAHVDVERAVKDTDADDAMEGLYLKVEDGGVVVDRCKWVRASFLQTVVASDSHWFGRPIVENGLAAGVDLFGARS